MHITEQAKYEESSVEGKGEERMRNEAETERNQKRDLLDEEVRQLHSPHGAHSLQHDITAPAAPT